MVRVREIMLVSSGVVVIGMLASSFVPLIVINREIWSSYLRPPYLYVIINLIIITIAACSRYGDKLESNRREGEVVVMRKEDEWSHYEVTTVVVEEKEEEEKVSGFEEKDIEAEETAEEEEEEFVISKSSTWTPSKRRVSPEKPLVSARFPHRKAVSLQIQGGRALRVSKPKRHETLENTWKAITQGRPMPLTRHFKKCDTWDSEIGGENTTPLVVKKSETFKDRSNYYESTEVNSSGKLRKESSLSQDELNKRVEAFINKFNEEMRLQRQESLNQYKEMVGGGGVY